MHKQIENASAAIDYIEKHLYEKLNLEIVAGGVGYSKYHLHRLFKETAGIRIHDYIQRRKLTEAAKLLIFSRKPILEIALIAGYESQQAFSKIFKELYKIPPSQYRKNQKYYALQLPYNLNPKPRKLGSISNLQEEIIFAKNSDIPRWMTLVCLVIDGFPHLEKQEYIEKLESYIQKNQAMLLQDKEIAIGIMAFNRETTNIDFLGIHPQYKKEEITRAFLMKAFQEMPTANLLNITTFRKGDKADLGYRSFLKKLGFEEAELLIEFDYPTQKFILQKDLLERTNA